MKVLNLYAGIGGNRKLWPKDIEVTAVEWNNKIANIYFDNFPDDNILMIDAHKYLLEHYKEYDFIWSSPPCPSHSIVRKNTSIPKGQVKPIYPDMKLYEEILFLKYHAKCKWVVENVKPYYPPLIKPYYSGRHCFWSNFYIPNVNIKSELTTTNFTLQELQNLKGFDLTRYNDVNKAKILKNCVNSKLGLHIFNCAFKIKQNTLMGASK